MVAHRLSTVRDADAIAVVSRGHIIEQAGKRGGRVRRGATCGLSCRCV